MSERPMAPFRIRKYPAVGAAFAVVAALTMLFALPAVAGTAAAQPGPAVQFAPAVTVAGTQWAFGGSKTVSADITVMENGTSYEIQFHGYFGWAVVFTQTNTSNSTFMIEVQRTAGSTVFANLCKPNCAHANLTANYTVSATDQATAFGNFTRVGTVYVAGVPVPALGILNAQGYRQGNYNATARLTGPGGVVLHQGSLTVSGKAQANVSFKPALGLIPLQLYVGEAWNSTATFAFAGSWAIQYQWTYDQHSGSGNPAGSLTANGTVTLSGFDAGTIHLDNGRMVHVIVLALNGPFDTRDGVIILPHEGDFLSGDNTAFHLGNTPVGSAVSPTAITDKVDFDLGAPHLGVTASATLYNGAVAHGPMVAGGLSAASTSVAGGDVQAQPMTVPAAQQLAQSLLGGGSKASSGLASLLVVALAVALVTIAGTVVTVKLRRRPRAPPPVRVPEQARRPVPVGALTGEPVPPPPAPPPQPVDPLGHLW